MSAGSEIAWIDLCALDEIPRLGSRVVLPPAGHPIAVFRTADDAVHAVVDRCPHKGGPLSQGIVHGDRVTCPLHGWQVELRSGEVVAPDKGCVKRRPVRVQDGRVQLQA
ncbi:MAG: assimilatory nitrite reductase small subunit [Pseudomonadota bacterium]|jgi:nitrite reductase (NADH) small subunit